jgi:anti-sigma regulatory factor (Ser/Thr protein kinase)
MTCTEAVLDFKIPPLPHLARVVREGVVDFARLNGVGDDDLAHFLTALGEALANAVEHARSDAPIEVEVRIGMERILASVQDAGVGFVADLGPEPDLPSLDAERGRGLPIMRRCCDIFAIASEPGKGTVVLIGRYLRSVEDQVVA